MTTRQISYRLKADGKPELLRDAADVGNALQSAGDRGAEAFGRTNRMLQQTEQLSEKQLARYRQLAEAARQDQAAQEAQARINGALGVGGGRRWSASDLLSAEDLDGKGLSKGQRAGRLNLMRQAGDVFTTGAMGMSPTMIAIQQGPQILDALAQAGIKVTPVLLGTAAGITAIGGALIAAAAAGAQYEAQQVKINVAVNGLGAALQMSASQLDAYAQAGARAGEVSVTAAVNMGVTYANTGKIGGQVMADLIAITKRYALTTGQDVDKATDDLAKHFSTGSKGVLDLNDKLHFLNAAEAEHIKNLMDSGRETEGQTLAVEALNKRLLDAKSATSGWDFVLGKLGDTAADVWRKVGKAIAVAMGGGSDQEKLKELLDKRSQAVLDQRSSLLYLGKKPEEYDREIREVQSRIAKDARTAAETAVKDRDTARAAIVKSNQDPNIQKRIDKENELAKYLSLGGVAGDSTAKAIQADINALKAGYASADEMARKLEQSHNKAMRAAEAADRKREADARKAAHAAEEQILMEGRRADHMLDNQRRLAEAAGDESALDVLKRQGRLQDEINRYLREGFSLTQATVNARAQISSEMQAEAQARGRALSNPDGFKSSEARLGEVLNGANIVPYSQIREFGDHLRVSTGDAFRDGLLAGMTGGNFFQVFAERLKYAAASALADSLTASLFGQRDGRGTTGKLVSLAMKFLPHFAAGTNSAPGGLSLVGEYGPEIVDLPRGSGVRTASQTTALLQNMAQRAASAGPGEVVNFHYAPTYQVQGTADEIRALRAEMDRDRKAFKANAVAAYADAKKRRQID